MKLYFNGCSHTVGICSDLHNIEQTYPYKLSKALNAEFNNSALPRSSNDRILRTTVEDIYSMDKLPDIAIIQWSYYERFETPLISNDYQHHRNLWKSYRLRDQEWKQYNPTTQIKVEKTYNPIFYDFIDENRLNAMNSFLTKVILLDNFLSAKSIKPIHVFFPGSRIKKDNQLINTLFNNCNNSNFLNNPLNGIENYLDDLKFSRSQDLHFLEDAHDQICDWLKDFILYNKPMQFKCRDDMDIDNIESLFIYSG